MPSINAKIFVNTAIKTFQANQSEMASKVKILKPLGDSQHYPLGWITYKVVGIVAFWYKLQWYHQNIKTTFQVKNQLPPGLSKIIVV